MDFIFTGNVSCNQGRCIHEVCEWPAFHLLLDESLRLTFNGIISAFFAPSFLYGSYYNGTCNFIVDDLVPASLELFFEGALCITWRKFMKLQNIKPFICLFERVIVCTANMPPEIWPGLRLKLSMQITGLYVTFMPLGTLKFSSKCVPTNKTCLFKISWSQRCQTKLPKSITPPFSIGLVSLLETQTCT